MAERILADRYRLDERIGEGGMGSVYRATDLATNSPVAVKVLRRKLCEREHSRRRFAREARAAGTLDHPGIVRVLDHGEDDRPFLVMELLEGTSLRRHVRRVKPTPAGLLEIMVELCDALSHAHSRGIIHRDLKPDNLFITPLGRLKVLDFGLARITRAPELSVLTRSGTALGTCSYMAPEQAAGKEADERSDLYSVGVMLYEFLCGMVPFSADDPASVLYMHVHQDPESPRSVNPDLHLDLERLILCLMEKDPARRPASARILGLEMKRLASRLNGEFEERPALPAAVASAEAGSTLVFTTPAPRVAREAPPPRGEPDRVCLLTADIPEFSRLGLDRNPLEVSEILTELTAEVDDALAVHTGRLLERNGTRIVAAFAGVDAGLRAARAVERMRLRVQAVFRRHGLPSRVLLSAGIFGGSLPPRAPGDSWEQAARKELLHGAQRLELLARDLPDATLICADSLDDRLPVQPVRSVFVRGRREPVQVYRVVGA